MIRDSWFKRIPFLGLYFSLLFALLLASHWLKPVQDFFFNIVAIAGPLPKSIEGHWIEKSPLEPLTGFENKEELKARNARLILENSFLRRELSSLKALRKSSDTDLHLLSVDAISLSGFDPEQLWTLNAGQDLRVRAEDLVLQDSRIVGRVLAVSQNNALCASSSATDASFLVRLPAQTASYLWQGCGQKRAVISVPLSISENFLGAQVSLFSSMSTGGGLLLGEVEGIQPDRNNTTARLVVKAYDPDFSRSFWIGQKKEDLSMDLFTERSRLSELKREVNKLESLRLKAELSRRTP